MLICGASGWGASLGSHLPSPVKLKAQAHRLADSISLWECPQSLSSPVSYEQLTATMPRVLRA